MRKLYVVRLQEEERAQLQGLIRKGKAAAYQLTHARVLLKADRVTHEQIRAAHFEPIDDVSSAVNDALQRAGSGATLCALPNGPQTIPYVAE